MTLNAEKTEFLGVHKFPPDIGERNFDKIA